MVPFRLVVNPNAMLYGDRGVRVVLEAGLRFPRILNGRAAAAALVPAFVLAACSGDSTEETAAPPPSVSVLSVTERPFSASTDFVGRTLAYQEVDILARVTGFLIKQGFQDGSDIDEGTVLYEIDPAEFDAAVSAAEAGVEKAQAALTEAETTLQRTQTLADKGTVSQAELDNATAVAGQAKADLAAAQADLETAKLNQSYTHITSPISGRISGSIRDVGNLIGPDSGVLATVINLDPIRVSFSLAERTYLNFVEAQDAGNAPDFEPKLELANGQVYDQVGTLAFIDNQVDQGTGTVQIFLDFPNAKKLLLPGQFVNVILTQAESENEIMIPQAAVQQNQVGPFVLVVDGENTVQLRQIKTGATDGTDIVVTDGLSVGESIIIDGIQKTRPGGVVTPVPAPTTEAS